MSKDQKRVIEFWHIVNGLDRKAASEVKDYLYRCAANNADAVFFISGSGGNSDCVSDIMATIENLDVHVTTIGFGVITDVVAAVFCLGDERVLMDGAILRINALRDDAAEAYTTKTLLSKELFKEKVVEVKSKYWEMIKKEEWKKYGITTLSYSRMLKRILAIVKGFGQVKMPMFFFHEEFNAESALKAIVYIYSCAINNQDAIMEISSNGGKAACLCAIIDTLRLTKVKLITVGGGLVASCAADLFLMGEIRALKNKTTFLVHRGSYELTKNSSYVQEELEKFIEELRISNAKTESFWLPRLTITKEEYYKKVEGGKDWIVPEEEWKKWGIVTTEYDEVLKIILERMKTE